MLKDYLKEELILIDPPVDDKKSLFRYISEILAKKGLVSNKKIFFKSLMQREKLGNTEYVENIAIPHAHCNSVRKLFISLIISGKGIDYDSPDKGKAQLIYLIGSPVVNHKEYLRLLAFTARMIKIPELSNKLISSGLQTEVIDHLRTHDLYDCIFRKNENRLLIITIYQVDWLNNVLAALVELGIGSASVISSTSLAKRLSYDIPVFAGLKLKSLKQNTKTYVVFVNIADPKISGQLASLLKEEGFDLEKPGNGFMQVFKVKEIIGHSDEFF